jgi:hypothetical protein
MRRRVDARCSSGVPCMSPENNNQIQFVHDFATFLTFAYNPV